MLGLFNQLWVARSHHVVLIVMEKFQTVWQAVHCPEPLGCCEQTRAFL